MAWNGSGTFTRTNGSNTGSGLWAADATAGTKITAANHDTHDEDIATALNACLTKNMETKPTADFVPNVTTTYDLGTTSLKWEDLHLNGNALIGGTVTLTGGKLAFPATQSTSADVNTLDDYEEGTWTPQLSDGTIDLTMGGSALGFYTKIGRLVFINCTVVSTATNGASGSIRIDDLPFPADNVGSQPLASAISSGINITAASALTAYIVAGQSHAFIQQWNDAATGTNPVTVAQWTADGSASFSGCYHTTT